MCAEGDWSAPPSNQRRDVGFKRDSLGLRSVGHSRAVALAGRGRAACCPAFRAPCPAPRRAAPRPQDGPQTDLLLGQVLRRTLRVPVSGRPAPGAEGSTRWAGVRGRGSGSAGRRRRPLSRGTGSSAGGAGALPCCGGRRRSWGAGGPDGAGWCGAVSGEAGRAAAARVLPRRGVLAADPWHGGVGSGCRRHVTPSGVASRGR